MLSKKIFVDIVLKDFLSERQTKGKKFHVFYIGGGILSPKPLEVGIHICGGHLWIDTTSIAIFGMWKVEK